MGEIPYFRSMALQANNSLFWILLLLPLAFGIAWYFYRGNAWLKSQSKALQRGLPFLRGFGLFLIMLLLLKITLLFNQSEVERPALITLIDNSESLKRFKDSNQLAKKIADFSEKIQDRFADRYDLYFYTIGTNIRESNRYLLNEEESNHELAFKQLSEQFLNRNVGAVVFASDGNYNVGDNPSYAAEQLSLTPIFTLGIGDTTPKKDQIVANLFYNDVVFLNDVFPIEVDVEAFKIKNTQAVVRLSQNGTLIDSKTITYKNEENAFNRVQFQVTAQKSGFQAYTVSVEYLNGEFSKANNTKTCYIEVIDSRNSVCFMGSSPHPDLAALRSVAETNKNYQTSFVTPQELVTKNLKPDLVVWHSPNLPNDQEALNFLKRNKIAVLFIIPGNFSNATLEGLDLFNLNNARGQTDEIQGTMNPGFSTFDLSEKAKTALEFFPPLVCKFGKMAPKGNYEVYILQKIENTRKSEPLFYFNKRAALVHGLIYGEGVWRWRLSDYMKSKNHEQFNEIFLRAYAYLMVKREGMGLTVQLDKRFAKNDRIGANAHFYNASLDPITTPKISLSLRDAQGKKYAFQFATINDGYRLDIGSLPPGKYHWIATTQYQNKPYRKEGDFLIEDVSLEKSINAANHGILRLLSQQSGGEYYPFSENDRLLNVIEKRTDITSIERITTRFWDLVDSWFFLLMIALCFFLEWFFKRYYGAY